MTLKITMHVKAELYLLQAITKHERERPAWRYISGCSFRRRPIGNSPPGQASKGRVSFYCTETEVFSLIYAQSV